jgi:hypothetical protein
MYIVNIQKMPNVGCGVIIYRIHDACIKNWIQQRLDYHYEVRQYFKDRPNDFMVLDIDDPEKITKLSEFIGIPLIWNGSTVNARPLDSLGSEYKNLMLQEFKRIDRILS